MKASNSHSLFISDAVSFPAAQRSRFSPHASPYMDSTKRTTIRLSDERQLLIERAKVIVAEGPADDPPTSDVLDAALTHLIESEEIQRRYSVDWLNRFIGLRTIQDSLVESAESLRSHVSLSLVAFG